MRFFFDTEFYEDGQAIELISIGIVAEDGREFYAETPQAIELCHRSDWLKANVLQHLVAGTMLARSRIAIDIVTFVGDKPEFWAYYADYDWVVLCQLFGRMIDLPKGWPMYCLDVKQLAHSIGNPKLRKQETKEHNALDDAKWAHQAWKYLQWVKNGGVPA